MFVLAVGPAAYGAGLITSGHHDLVSVGMLAGGVAVGALCVVLGVRHHRRRRAAPGDHPGSRLPGTGPAQWVYIPGNYPTRMRSLGTGWTDGVGHLGAWGGVLLSGVVFTAAAPLGWILLITIPGALLPASMVAIFGKRQRRRTLEELAR